MMALVSCAGWTPFAGINLGVPAGAVRGGRGRQSARRAVYLLPRQRRAAHGAVLAAARRAGTAADAAGGAAAAVRGAAEPTHRLAHHIIGIAVLMVRGRRLRRRAVALVDRRRPAHRRGLRIALGGSSAEEAGRQVRGGHGHPRLAHPGMVRAARRPVTKGPTEWADRRARSAAASSARCRARRCGRAAQLLRDDPAADRAWSAWSRSSRSPAGCCGRCGGPRPASAGLLAPGVFPALLAMQLVWFLTWIPGMEQGIVTGSPGRGAWPALPGGAGPAPVHRSTGRRPPADHGGQREVSAE